MKPFIQPTLSKLFQFVLVLFILLGTSCAQNLFQATYGGAGSTQDAATAIAKTSGNQLLMAGSYAAKPYLLKLDGNGNVVWSNTYTSSPFGLAVDVKETSDNGVVVLGRNALGADIFVLKTDGAGNTIWGQSYNIQLGGSSVWTFPTHIEEMPNKDFLITGSLGTFVIVIRLDSIGNWKWGNRYGGSNDFGQMVKVDSSGDIWVVGERQGQNMSFLLKLAPLDGQVIWSKGYDMAGECGVSLQLDNNGCVFSTHVNNDIGIIRTDPTGALTWAKKYNVSFVQNNCSIGLTSDGGYVVQGSHSSGLNGLFLMKTDGNGTPQWFRTYTGNNDIAPTSPPGHGNPTPVQLNDGGFALVGRTYSYGTSPSNAFLIRTDKNGNSPCHMTSQMPTVVDITQDVQAYDLGFIDLPLSKVTNVWTPNSTETGLPAEKVCEQLNCIQLPSGMTAWYPFNNNTQDVVGGNHAIAGGGTPVLYDYAVVQKGLVLNGSSDYYLAPDASALNFGTGDFSIDFWIRADNSNTNTRTILDKRTLSPVIKGYSLFLSNNVLGIQLADGTHSNYLSTGPNITDNNWHFITVTVERNSTTGGKFYIDGSPAGIFDPTGRQGSLNNTSPLLIGKQAVNAVFFSGSLDELEFFDRPLDVMEVQDIYVARSTGKCATSVYAPECSTLCQNDASIVVGITVCNFGTSSQTYTMLPPSGLPQGANGGGCNINGPTATAFSILTPSVTVGAGNCGLFQIQINRPADMDLPFETACYNIGITDAQGKVYWASGCLTDRSDLCRQALLVNDQDYFKMLTAGQSEKLKFQIENNAKEAKNFAWRIQAYSLTGNRVRLSLNSQLEGELVEGRVALKPGEQSDLPFEAIFNKHRSSQACRVVLETDENDDGSFEQAFSMILNSQADKNTK